MSFDYQKICAVLYREARLLDERRWDDWLACYAEDVTYWMPAWDDDDQLTDDHESQISLMYYPDRGGLEDVTNVEVLAERDNEVDVRYNFNTLSHRYKTTDQFFGTMFVTLRKVNDELLISYKRIVLKDDYIRQVLDVYHV
jgi:benzoate/toluate 1,2-dioxygenase beta subunit